MKWNLLTIKISTVITLLFSKLALAHDGAGYVHSVVSGGLHPLTGLDHALVMLAVGGWAAQLAYQQRNASVLWKVPTAFVLTMTISALLAMAGIGSALDVEPGIGLSVVLMGLLLTVGLNVSAMFGAFIVAVFAVFHGLAHGAEIPFEMGVIGYSLGFIFATVLLHIIGIILFSRVLPTQAKQDNGRFLVRWNTVIGMAISLSGIYLLTA